MLFVEGKESPLLARFWNFLPRKEGTVRSDLRLNIADLLPADPRYYSFDGSLTTTPCSESVSWYMITEPVEASASQMDKFHSIFGSNNRPVQPLNERSIGEV